MLNGVDVSALSRLYSTQGKEFSNLAYKIGSGKEINKPSDDFVGYTRAKNIEQDIGSYKKINTNLTELRAASVAASDLGNSVYEDLTRMKELAVLYADAAGDTDTQATYSAEFSALATGVTDTIANNEYGGQTIMSAGTLGSAEINPDDATLKVSLDFVAGDVTDVSTFALGTEDDTHVQAELVKVTSFMVKSDNYLSQIDRQIELNANLITAKEDTVNAITSIDEVKALAEVTELQVRQQATVSMIAQANLSAGNVASLY